MYIACVPHAAVPPLFFFLDHFLSSLSSVFPWFLFPFLSIFPISFSLSFSFISQLRHQYTLFSISCWIWDSFQWCPEFSELETVWPESMELPPGFRFHPTDEELITHYLSKKVLDCSFSAAAIGEVDMNKVEPWELPRRAKLGEKEWFFFCVRDKKYPTGLRTNRATASGYWKATGKDKEIFREKALVGMKKTLVFYKGRAPKGEKSNWVSHEYRLEGKYSVHNIPKSAKTDWVISRVFQKTSGGEKVHISGLTRMDTHGNQTGPLTGPPLTDPVNVHCFSNSVAAPQQKIQEDLMVTCFDNPIHPSSSNPVDFFPFSRGQFGPIQGAPGFRFPGSVPLQDPSTSGTSRGGHGPYLSRGFKTEKEMEVVGASLETLTSAPVPNLEMGTKSFEEASASVGLQDLDCIWSY